MTSENSPEQSRTKLRVRVRIPVAALGSCSFCGAWPATPSMLWVSHACDGCELLAGALFEIELDEIEQGGEVGDGLD